MTIKTEQLAHSYAELDRRLQRLDQLTMEKPHLSELKFRGLVKEISNSIRDCIVIIASILSEHKDTT